ncbi:hypothetical protein COLO4_07557 [Corchorus olitorius]|uniref:Uncharacterized protein n=1 Tax=Corchorus olitorius TaxID=93759 RepID=A0A1R3KJC2_9ROSI|nr:hypothetical protein COLO4_07557 [Corchorus olitorius]
MSFCVASLRIRMELANDLSFVPDMERDDAEMLSWPFPAPIKCYVVLYVNAPNVPIVVEFLIGAAARTL